MDHRKRRFVWRSVDCTKAICNFVDLIDQKVIFSRLKSALNFKLIICSAQKEEWKRFKETLRDLQNRAEDCSRISSSTEWKKRPNDDLCKYKYTVHTLEDKSWRLCTNECWELKTNKKTWTSFGFRSHIYKR